MSDQPLDPHDPTHCDAGVSRTADGHATQSWQDQTSQNSSDHGKFSDRINALDAIGPYRIVGQLGEGGMGTVYRAEQNEPIKRSVAIKVVRAEFGSNQVIARFEAERQALARMDHPNISKVLDAGSDRGRPYFVMELAPGVPVTRFCDENKLSIRDRLELFVQICQAISHAHTKAILHRDIKASNVLAYFADGKPTVKVIDFGIAKAMTDDRLSTHLEATQMGRPIGTYEAMSPEQVEGSPDVDTRTDVYALGVLMYEMICGHKPFASLLKAGTNDLKIQKVICEVDPPRPSQRVSASADHSMSPEIADVRRTTPAELERQLRSELEWIPLKAMRKDRNRRYASPQELADDVENYLADRPLLAGPESRGYRLKKYLSRNRAAVIASIAAVLLLIAGVTFYIHSIRLEQKRTKAALEDVRKEKSEAQRQRDEAQRQTGVANAVVKFQRDMFSQADPEQARGDRVTVVEAIAVAVKKLDAGDLKGQPAAEIQVRRTISDTLTSLGQYAEAERQSRLAIEMARQLARAGEPDLYWCLDSLGNVLQSTSRFNEAEPLFREALTIARRIVPGSHDIQTLSNDLAIVLAFEEKFPEAEAIFRENTAAYQRSATTRPDDRELALELTESYMGIGGTVLRAGKPVEAEKAIQQGFEAARKGGIPTDHVFIANGSDILCEALVAQGRLTEAEHAAREALSIKRAVLPPDHPSTITSMIALDQLLQKQRRLSEAEAIRREVLAATRRANPPDPVQVNFVEGNLGFLLIQEQRLADAEPLLREALNNGLNNLPAELGNVVSCASALSRAMSTQGKSAEAAVLLTETLERCRKSLPADNPAIIDMLETLSVIQLDSHHVEQAAAGFQQAQTLIKQKDSPDPLLAARATAGVGRVLLAQGKPEQALPLLEKATQDLSRLPAGPQDPNVIIYAAGPLADALDQLRRNDEAEKVRKDHGVPKAIPATQTTHEKQ